MTERYGQILDAALDVARTQGLAAISMRTVAERVGVTPMALYRHVEDKDALLDGLVGKLLAEVTLPEPGQPWRDGLRLIGRELHHMAQRYPSVAPLLLTRVYVAHHAVRVVDAMYALLTEAGVPPHEVPRIERLLSTFLLGYAVSAANDAFWRNADTDPSVWEAELGANITDLIALVERVSRSPADAD
jgi:AcrR family transcriptional regulator